MGSCAITAARCKGSSPTSHLHRTGLESRNGLGWNHRTVGVGITEQFGLQGTAKGHKFSGTACPWCCWFPPIPSSLLSMCLSRALRRPPGTLACLPFSWDAVLLGLEGMVLEGRRWSLGGRRWS